MKFIWIAGASASGKGSLLQYLRNSGDSKKIKERLGLAGSIDCFDMKEGNGKGDIINSKMELASNQEIIEPFNRDAQRYEDLRQRKLLRRFRFPKLSSQQYDILDTLDELREKRKPVNCVSQKWME